MTVPLATLPLPDPAPAEVERGRSPLEHWYGSAPSREQQIRLANMGRIQPAAQFVRLWHLGEPVAQGYAVLERGWLGLYSIETRPERRRQGWGTAVITHLCRWAAAQKAHTAYLQVYCENRPAIALYTKLGLIQQYAYVYWEKNLSLR